MLADQEFNEKSFSYNFNKALKNITIASKYVYVTFPLILVDLVTPSPREYINQLITKLYPDKNYSMIDGYVTVTPDDISRCSCFVTTNKIGDIVTSDTALINIAKKQFINKVLKGIAKGNIIRSKHIGIVNLKNIDTRLSWCVVAPKMNMNHKYLALLNYLYKANANIVDTGLVLRSSLETVDENSLVISIFLDKL